MYYIENKIFNKIGKDHVNTFPIKNKIVSKSFNKIEYPIKIHMNNVSIYMRQAFNIISDKFILVEELAKYKDYEIINIYGGFYPINSDIKITLPYIRNLYFQYIPLNNKPNKNIFITRKYSYKQHNKFKRYIMNETKLIERFKKYNFEYIILENYTFENKIKLFQNAKTIISSHSAALTFIIFCNKQTNIIEILNKGTNGFNHNHYIDISKVLNLQGYKRYSNIKEDKMGNFNLNIDQFENYLLDNKII